MRTVNDAKAKAKINIRSKNKINNRIIKKDPADAKNTCRAFFTPTQGISSTAGLKIRYDLKHLCTAFMMPSKALLTVYTTVWSIRKPEINEAVITNATERKKSAGFVQDGL